MTCPKCGGDMNRYERNGVDIDQCSDCRGIFLDRGELERLIDAESSFYGSEQAAPEPSSGHGGKHGGGRRRRKESFLSDLFD